MEKNWLLPLTRIPAEQYLHVAKDLAAKRVQRGSRVTQKYYFNGNNCSNPLKETLAWVADRMQHREGVRNALIVKDKKHTPNTISKLFAILVGRYGGAGGKHYKTFEIVYKRK